MLENFAVVPAWPAHDSVVHGRRVIEIEAQALTAVAASLGPSFADAIALLEASRGRIVVAGMGKSGHVARKIASTLASTGTPALYLHPSEAAHGDMGMLVSGDTLLILSNSGSTVELLPLLDRAKLLRIPMIGVTSGERSPITRQAAVTLLLPLAEEACPFNLAPTTSTVMMMAMGDALAMALMRVRGVSRDGFEALHPGGTIGARRTRVSAVMHRGDRVPLVARETPMREVIPTMTALSFGVAGVIDNDRRLIGVITDGDLRRHIDDLLTSTAADVMTRDPAMIEDHSFVEDALALMTGRKITSLFVTAGHGDRRPVGMVHVHDFLRLNIE